MTMIKMKVADLIGPQLDWAVATVGKEWESAHKLHPTMTLTPNFGAVEIRDFSTWPMGSAKACVLIPVNPMRQDPKVYEPSVDWLSGGQIIERDHVFLNPPHSAHISGGPNAGWHHHDGWTATVSARTRTLPPKFEGLPGGVGRGAGPTALIAAMRAVVASHWGKECEVPEILA